MDKSNVIVYIMDSARYDDFIDIYTTFEHPLKKNFVAFPNAYSFGTWTKPASSSILFGLPARVTGMKAYNDAIPRDIRDVYAPLRQCGYVVNLLTACVITSSAFGYDEYFDFFCDTFGDERGISLQSNVPDRIFSEIQEYASGQDLKIVPSDLLHSKFLSQVETSQHKHITFIWSMDTHDPYYDLSCEGEPEMVVTNKEIREADPLALEKAHELHRRSIEYNLNSFFTLLEAIRSPRYQDTMIFLISDHGDAFGERCHIRSFRPFARKPIVSHDTFPIQEIIRVPFFVKFPQRWTGNCDARKPVTTNSILPTIFDFLGVASQIPLFGTSLTNHDSPDPWVVVCEHWRGRNSYVALIDRQNGWQFIGRLDQDRELSRGSLGQIKDWIKNSIQSRYGILGTKSLGNGKTSKPDIGGIGKALDRYLQRCGEYGFEYSKVKTHLDGEEAVMRRLRDLGYVE